MCESESTPPVADAGMEDDLGGITGWSVAVVVGAGVAAAVNLSAASETVLSAEEAARDRGSSRSWRKLGISVKAEMEFRVSGGVGCRCC